MRERTSTDLKLVEPTNGKEDVLLDNLWHVKTDSRKKGRKKENERERKREIDR